MISLQWPTWYSLQGLWARTSNCIRLRRVHEIFGGPVVKIYQLLCLEVCLVWPRGLEMGSAWQCPYGRSLTRANVFTANQASYMVLGPMLRAGMLCQHCFKNMLPDANFSNDNSECFAISFQLLLWRTCRKGITPGGHFQPQQHSSIAQWTNEAGMM